MTSDKFDQEYQLLAKDTEANWKKDLITDKHTFRIKYASRVIDGKREAMIQEITSRIEHKNITRLLQEDYEIVTDSSGHVTNIKHRRLGDVKFVAVHRDDDAGFQSGSVVKLWTHHNSKLFNIVHIHLNDTSE